MKENFDRRYAAKALAAAAMGFYDKNPYTQYEGYEMTIEPREISGRTSWNESVQMAEFDQYHYTVCSSFTGAVYRQAFGYDILNAEGVPYYTREYENLTGPEVVYMKKKPREEELPEMIADVQALLEPGDVLVVSGSRGGHAMLYLGDFQADGRDWLIHCWGKHMQNGVDRVEPEGAIKLQTAEELLYQPKTPGKPSRYMRDMPTVDRFVCIYRPFLAENFALTVTPETLSRMAYPRITVNKFLDLTQFNSVRKGERVTMTVELINRSAEDYRELEVEEPLPIGAVLREGTLRQRMTVPAGGSLRLSFVYEVTGEAGGEVVFPEGRADRIPTRSITLQIGASKLSGAQAAELNRLAEETAAGTFRPGRELAAVRTLTEALSGESLALPDTVQEAAELCFRELKAEELEEPGLVRKPEGPENRLLHALQVRKMFGGKYLLMRDGSCRDRCLEHREEFFEIGDVLVTLWGESRTRVRNAEDALVTVYLGNDRMLTLRGDRAVIGEGFSDWLLRLLDANLYFVLRPSLVLPEKDRS